MKVSAEEFEDFEVRFGCLSERDQRLIIAGFEEANKQMVDKVRERRKKEVDVINSTAFLGLLASDQAFIRGFISALKWLECDLI